VLPYTGSMAKKQLHIVDGESTGGSLRVAGFHKDGYLLPWRDSLDSGPVPRGLTLRHLSRLRSRFWTGKSTTAFDQRTPRSPATRTTRRSSSGLGPHLSASLASSNCWPGWESAAGSSRGFPWFLRTEGGSGRSNFSRLTLPASQLPRPRSVLAGARGLHSARHRQ